MAYAVQGHCKATPWGFSDSVKGYGRSGVEFHSTPSHGGFWVPAAARKRIPEPALSACQREARRGWFEEDCDAVVVALTFPEVLEQYATAQRETVSTVRAGMFRSVARWHGPAALVALGGGSELGECEQSLRAWAAGRVRDGAGGRIAELEELGHVPRCDDPGAHGPGCQCDGGEVM